MFIQRMMFCALVFLGCVAGQPAHAIPPSVMEPYRAYMAAIEADDLQSASGHAEAAYRAGVADQIDRDTLVILAENRAQIFDDLDDYARAARAWDDLHALTPDTGIVVNAASAYLLAGETGLAGERARSIADGLHPSRDADLSWFARYVIAVAEGPRDWPATTGREALARGGAPSVFQDLVAEGSRHVERGRWAEQWLFAGKAAGVAQGLGLHQDVVTHVTSWIFTFRMSEADGQRALDLAAQSPLAGLLVRQGVFPESRPPQNPDDVLENDQEPLRYEPRYPISALERGLSGYTMLRFDVSEQGVPENIEVLFSIPDIRIFDRDSIRAVEMWRYPPRLVDGVPVRREGEETSMVFQRQRGR